MEGRTQAGSFQSAECIIDGCFSRSLRNLYFQWLNPEPLPLSDSKHFGYSVLGMQGMSLPYMSSPEGNTVNPYCVSIRSRELGGCRPDVCRLNSTYTHSVFTF